jgi:UDP:flavonoid glycosyltransferase YjiC (YdhE family)
MAGRDRATSFVDAAATTFLARRRRHRRMRAAAARGLTDVDLAAAPAPGEAERVPPLSIVVMVVGSRGDVQPFIPIGRRLAQRHRVRIATHRDFRPMVEGAGLEFYPLAGDPHDLMEYMVRTGGRIIPTRLDLLVEDVPKKRAMMAEILASTWRACTEPDPDRPHAPAFRADAIVANPPSSGHIHCAEALHIPLHMVFTMPWSPTSAFPHPFARIDPGRHRPVQNFLSYGAVELLIWSGIGDLVNAFRREILALPPLGLDDGAALLEDHQVPFTYLWPDVLVPRPADWGSHIDLANFTVDDQAHAYEPPGSLLDFLAAGEAPIYVGFGSVGVEDPAAITRIILTALDKAGARGIVSEGWAHLGGEALPPRVFLIGDCPHDWLFPRCRAVCHHGGAGTTAAGLRAGLPTVVVPSFGDQFFWGQTVATAGAGPEPLPLARLDSAKLAEAFAMSRQPQVRDRARALGARLRETDGAELAVQSIYRHLHPYGPVDWSTRPAHGLVRELGELLGDAGKALQAGLDEILLRTRGRRS